MNDNEDLLYKIQIKMPELSKGQKRIASFLLEHYDQALHLTAAKLGEIAGVSESTVVRFAIEMDFDGYPRLQKALEELVKNRLTASQRMRVAYDTMAKGEKELLKTVMMADAERINSTLAGVNEEEFENAVRAILNGKRIYIVGGRSSASLSYFLSFYLNYMVDNVINVTANTVTETFENIFRIDKEDVFIGISFPRYSRQTIKAMQYAKEKGAKTIAITDSKVSPLVQYADISLAAGSDMVSFVDSLVAPMSLINALLVAISMNKREEIEHSLDRLERMWNEYQIYSSSVQKKYL